MKPALFCLALGVLPVPGGSWDSPVAPVTVYTQFQQTPPPIVLDSLKREMAALMSPIGVPFAWRSLAARSGNEISVHLMVATFTGRCDLAGLEPLGPASGTLGLTHVSDGVILPFTEVDCNAIRRFLRRRLHRIDVEKRDEVFGRAIGRVLAHEFYHIFANTLHHGSGGVAEPCYSEQELVSDEFRLQDSELRALWAAFGSRGARSVQAGSPQAGGAVFAAAGCQACHEALHAAHRPLEFVDLALLLRNNTSKMYHRSQQLKIPLPSLSERDIGDVVSFLNCPSP